MSMSVREARISAAHSALRSCGLGAYVADCQIEKAAATVVDALFTPDPFIDNAVVR